MRAQLKWVAAVAFVLLSTVNVAHAVTSANFVFDTISDPGDLADGPDYVVTGSGPVDDGSGCDTVVMVMVDPTGTPTDVDSFCLSLATGQGGSDGDNGAFETGYLPVASPVTYALFDVDASDLAAISGFGDNEQEYFDYVVANGRLLAQNTFAVDGLPSSRPYSFAGRLSSVPVPANEPAALGLLAAAMAGVFAWQTRRRLERR